MTIQTIIAIRPPRPAKTEAAPPKKQARSIVTSSHAPASSRGFTSMPARVGRSILNVGLSLAKASLKIFTIGASVWGGLLIARSLFMVIVNKTQGAARDVLDAKESITPSRALAA